MDAKTILLALADLAANLKDGSVDPGDLDALVKPLTDAIAAQILPHIDEPDEQAKLARAEQLLRLIAQFV
jgi:phosphoglycolate phosphatase-like HAD superfamily hydrolase